MKRSNIGWTDFSGGCLNWVSGCTGISEGCRNCYARAIYERFGRDFSQVRYDVGKLLAMAQQAWPADGNRRGPHSKPMCFVCDTGDLFHTEVYEGDLLRAFLVMNARPDVTWQVLTKRTGRMAQLVNGWAGVAPIKGHMWLGTSVEDQASAKMRLPLLLEMDAPMRWVSVEPMLGPMRIWPWLQGIDWVVCGGESGPDRRPFDADWALDLYDQCEDAGVPFFYKQGSALRPGEDDELPGIGLVQEWPG